MRVTGMGRAVGLGTGRMPRAWTEPSSAGSRGAEGVICVVHRVLLFFLTTSHRTAQPGL